MPTGGRDIAIYVPALVGGGAERVAALLASGLCRAGHRATLVTDFDAPENKEFVDAGVPTVTLGGSHVQSTMRLARFLSERRCAIALAIGASADLKLVAAQAIARTDTRLILSYHGTSTVGRGLLGWSGYPLAALLTRVTDRTVCVSDYLARHMVEEWHASRARVVRIYNPVQIESARPAGSVAELMRRPPAIIALGRLAAEKDFTTLVRALALVPRRDSRLVIYGDGPDRDALRRLADELGLGGRVELPGYVAAPWDAYAKASCFALTSRSEAFGNVVVEALASGLPVVSTDCGGPTEILENGRFGEIVSVGRPDALAAAIGRALDQPGDPAPRIARARTFAVEAIVKRYIALFDDILSDR